MKANRLEPSEKQLKDIHDNIHDKKSSDIYDMAVKMQTWAKHNFDAWYHPSGAWSEGGHAQSTGVLNVDENKLREWKQNYFPKLQNLYDKLYDERGRPSDYRKIEDLQIEIDKIRKDVEKRKKKIQEEDMRRKEHIAQAKKNARKHEAANDLLSSNEQLKHIKDKYRGKKEIHKMADNLVKWARDHKFDIGYHPFYDFVERSGGQGYELNSGARNNWYSKCPELKNLEEKLKAENGYYSRGGSRRRRKQNKSITSKKNKKNTQS